MATYLPPLEDLGIFDSAIFSTDSTYLTIGTARKLFLAYPYAQGTQNFTDITVAGTSTVKKIIQNIIGSAGTSTDNNVQFGDSASYTALTTGTNNIAIGYGTFDALTTGIGNVAIGSEACGKLTTAQKTVAIGRDVLKDATTVSGAICIGYRAGYNTTTTGTDSIAIGNSAGFTTLSNNVIILNASGAPLNSGGTSRFYVRPVRNLTTFGQLLYYDNVSAEAVYSAPILNSGFPMTLALGVTDYGTTLNGTSTYLGGYNILTGATSATLVTNTTTTILSITIPIGVSIINITEKLNITTTMAITRMRRTLSTDGTITSAATGTVILDQTYGPSTVHTYHHTYTYTVINSTGVAISGSYVVNFVFSSGAMTVQANATTVRIA